MSRPDKPNRHLLAKLKKLDKLARATAKLSVEIFGDTISATSVPPTPKPKKPYDVMQMASSVPPTPKPKLESLALIAEGALSIGQGVEEILTQDSES